MVRSQAPNKERWQTNGKSLKRIISRALNRSRRNLTLGGILQHCFQLEPHLQHSRNCRDSANIFATRRVCDDADWNGAISFRYTAWAAISSGLSKPSHWWLPLGLLINAYEISTSLGAPGDLLAGFSQLQPTYHLGRLSVSIGWIGFVVLAIRTGWLASALAAVGRMAANQLSPTVSHLPLHFYWCWIGPCGRAGWYQLYSVVLLIWIFQLWFSPWWLKRYQLGPSNGPGAASLMARLCDSKDSE